MSLENTLKHVLSKNCSIQIFGLGYVGFLLAIRLTSSGFKVNGLGELSQSKTTLM